MDSRHLTLGFLIAGGILGGAIAARLLNETRLPDPVPTLSPDVREALAESASKPAKTVSDLRRSEIESPPPVVIDSNLRLADANGEGRPDDRPTGSPPPKSLSEQFREWREVLRSTLSRQDFVQSLLHTDAKLRVPAEVPINVQSAESLYDALITAGAQAHRNHDWFSEHASEFPNAAMNTKAAGVFASIFPKIATLIREEKVAVRAYLKPDSGSRTGWFGTGYTPGKDKLTFNLGKGPWLLSVEVTKNVVPEVVWRDLAETQRKRALQRRNRRKKGGVRLDVRRGHAALRASI